MLNKRVKNTYLASMLLVVLVMIGGATKVVALPSLQAPSQAILNTSWYTTQFDKVSKVKKRKATLNISDEKRISGKTSCNNYMGSILALTDSKMTFSRLATTLKMCIDKHAMQEERAFLQKFSGKTLPYRLQGTELIIGDITFQKLTN